MSVVDGHEEAPPAVRPIRIDDFSGARRVDRGSGACEQVDAGVESVAARAEASCVVVSFQNGVRNADLLRAALFGRAVLAGMVPFNVVHTDDGGFHNGTSGPLEFDSHGDLTSGAMDVWKIDTSTTPPHFIAMPP